MKYKYWKNGLFYGALHHVGDDSVKLMIERRLAKELQPIVLDKVAQIFKEETEE